MRERGREPATGAEADKIQLIDCTLREGDQSPGVWFSLKDKLALFEALDSAGIDIVDAGMPAHGEGERALLKVLAHSERRAEVAASVRVNPEEIALAAACDVDAVFMIFPISALHKERLGVDEAQWQSLGAKALDAARRHKLKPYLVLEDASRATQRELEDGIKIAKEGGAELAMLCDTVGVLTPAKATRLVQWARDAAGDALKLGTHFHNDFGMASANTIAAIEAGATHPSVTLNGLGERAGNASLPEVVMALDLLLGSRCAIDPEALVPLAHLAEELSGVPLGPQAPIVGPRAFLHESGIHVDGVMKNPRNYEAIPPEALGLSRRIVFGKHSGRAALRGFAALHGYPQDDTSLRAILNELQRLGPGALGALPGQGVSPIQGNRADIIHAWRRLTQDIGVSEAYLASLFDAQARRAQ